MIAPGAVFLACPFPKNEYANNNPSPAPGFYATIKKIDFPAANDCCIPNG